MKKQEGERIQRRGTKSFLKGPRMLIPAPSASRLAEAPTSAAAAPPFPRGLLELPSRAGKGNVRALGLSHYTDCPPSAYKEVGEA